MRNPVFVIVVDIGLLDMSTNIWKEQLNFLYGYFGRASFVWMLNHDTSNTIKMELRRKGHVLMVNKPLYKAKMIHILEAVKKERNLELQKKNRTASRTTMKEGDFSEMDSTLFDASSTDDSDITEMSGSKSMVRLTNESEYLEENNLMKEESCTSSTKSIEDIRRKSLSTKETYFQDEDSECKETNRNTSSSNGINDKKSLEGLRILLAEDTTVLQRVATIMLEKMGAVVIAVSDGQQAVDALNLMIGAEDFRRESIQMERSTRSKTEISSCHPYDLILMDCQMPKMDGYEATKAIRKSEDGTGLHIPIVALTAHAMPCDEAKCLQVGMDAYLTKPIDFKEMVSTILSLTKRTS